MEPSVKIVKRVKVLICKKRANFNMRFHISFFQNDIWRFIVEISNMVKLEIANNMFFSVSLLAAIGTSFFNSPKWEYIDLKVILCIFELMIIVKAFEEYALLQHIAVKLFNSCKSERRLTWALCLASFLLSMFLTNDVAILTMIPILIAISKKSSYSIIFPSIFVTISANLGSSATPFGNPQNLFLFSFYKLKIESFFIYSLPLCLLSVILILGFGFLTKSSKVHVVLNNVNITDKKRIAAFTFLLVFAILSVFNIVSYLIIFPIIILTTLFLNKNLLKKVDYRLLLSFVFIFIAVGNAANTPELNRHLTNFVHIPSATYLSSLFLSQLISNVPSTIVIAPFTTNVRALYYGANIGGLGTPFASLASVISFSLFNHEYPEKRRKFLSGFLLLNLGCLIILGLIFLAIILNV